ncbi:hypothetical protein [Methanosarcina sp.]|uniref:hypothetical protein n=1 Tax=Methanosarcina sp. TaxID=2213 RepID=UPI003C779C97
MNENETPAPGTEKPLLWTDADFSTQIKLFEYQLFMLLKISKEIDITTITDNLKKVYDDYKDGKYYDAEKKIISLKKDIYELINNLDWKEKVRYFALLWGIFPIGYAIISMIISFSLIIYNGSYSILDVPLWASCIAVIGTSVQILIGIVNDIKDDDIITEYKRFWYVVLPFISFVFGFISFLLLKAGLISMTLGYITTNTSANISAFSGFSSGLINELSVSPPPAAVILICFLSGYATEWFINLLKTYTTKPAGV